MQNTKVYPKGSSEAIIQEKLTSLINEIKEIMYTPDYKRSQEFKNHSCNLTVLGVIISKFCEWDISEIQQVAEAALQDSNYYFRFAKVDELENEILNANIEIERLVSMVENMNKLIGNKPMHVFNQLDNLPQVNVNSSLDGYNYIEDFMSRYKKQGYYSANIQRYTLDELYNSLELREGHADFVIDNFYFNNQKNITND